MRQTDILSLNMQSSTPTMLWRSAMSPLSEVRHGGMRCGAANLKSTTCVATRLSGVNPLLTAVPPLKCHCFELRRRDCKLYLQRAAAPPFWREVPRRLVRAGFQLPTDVSRTQLSLSHQHYVHH